jgi:hypothetical protein
VFLFCGLACVVQLTDKLKSGECVSLSESPFEKFHPHVYAASALPAGTKYESGVHDLPDTSSLFGYCRELWTSEGKDRPMAFASGFRLESVQAITHSAAVYSAYMVRQEKLSNLRIKNGNYNGSALQYLSKLDDHQAGTLNAFQKYFQERAPGTHPLSVNTFYSFHGTRPEDVSSICENGVIATRTMDEGYFGAGFYSTLNIEYALRYSYGEFDHHEHHRRTTQEGRYPVIMFASCVSLAYPITSAHDYSGAQSTTQGRGTQQLQCDWHGKPLRTGFDCHVACVSEAGGYHAVDAHEADYVEVVIEQESQMLPIAVMWFRAV